MRTIPVSAVHRYAVATAIATFCLLIAGSLVTSTESGLAVPDWPLSYGLWFPPMVGGILYEHGHRLIAAVVGIMILILAVWLWKVEPRRWVRQLGYGALAALILQALLGGLTVLWLLPPQISIVHACLGQAVFCLVVCLAWCTSVRGAEPLRTLDDRRATIVRRLALSVAALAGLQLLLGAVIRHTGHAVFSHMGGALGLLALTGWLAGCSLMFRRQAPVVWWAVWRLMGLVGIQTVVGLLVFTNRGSVMLRTAHVAIGALLLAQAIVLAWEIVRTGTMSLEAR